MIDNQQIHILLNNILLYPAVYLYNNFTIILTYMKSLNYSLLFINMLYC